MANKQSYVSAYGCSGVKITTLSQIEGTGIKLPPGFIDLRAPGKLESLFRYDGNSNTLYGKNRPDDYALSSYLKNRIDYKNPNQGQTSIPNTKVGYAVQDARFVRDFLGSNQGVKFIRNQLILQGYQPFDETKVYNPASPISAAFRIASLGAFDSPRRHIDTSNVLGGILNGFGLGNIVSTIGGFLGRESQVPPPRSSVASKASIPASNGIAGIGLNNLFTGIFGGGDRSDEVVAPIARSDVKGLLRGQTATDAYNSVRYSRLVRRQPKGLFNRLFDGVASKFLNSTALGGIISPKQPWSGINFRADEKTYELYLNASGLFEPQSNIAQTGRPSTSFFPKLLASIFGAKPTNKFGGRVTQRFFVERTGLSVRGTSSKPSGRVRYLPSFRSSRYKGASTILGVSDSGFYTDSFGILKVGDKYTNNSTFIEDASISNVNLNQNTIPVQYYSANIGSISNYPDEIEYSDQLFNYKNLTDPTTINNFEDTFSDQNNEQVKKLIENFNSVIKNISGPNSNDKYNYTTDSFKNNTPIQFARLKVNSVGLQQLTETNQNTKYTKNNNGTSNQTYQGRFRTDKNIYPTRLGETKKDRYIRPTNNVDYVNALSVLSEKEFKDKYSNTNEYGIYGPDIIKFYFYDIINKKYIPFNATVKNISDSNSATWEPIEYLGRADKLYAYKGFTRSISFSFTINAHSIKELMPMWKRINYLVSLTKPSNYTNSNEKGFIVPPMVQLTLGDFFKNHNVLINTCTVSIPEETVWETLPEEISEKNIDWFFGPNSSITWKNNRLNSNIDQEKASSKGRVAQFPRTADIQMEMYILEKDRPLAGRTLWGDAPFSFTSEQTNESYELNTSNIDSTTVYKTDKDQANPSKNTFSQNIRTDVQLLTETTPNFETVSDDTQTNTPAQTNTLTSTSPFPELQTTGKYAYERVLLERQQAGRTSLQVNRFR